MFNSADKTADGSNHAIKIGYLDGTTVQVKDFSDEYVMTPA